MADGGHTSTGDYTVDYATLAWLAAQLDANGLTANDAVTKALLADAGIK